MTRLVHKDMRDEPPARHGGRRSARHGERDQAVGDDVGEIRHVAPEVGAHELTVFEQPLPFAAWDAGFFRRRSALEPAQIPALRKKHVIEQLGGSWKPAAWLQRDRQPLWIRRNPVAPLPALVIRVVQQRWKGNRHAHDPIASSTVSTRTAPSFRPRTPVSIAFRSPAMTTANLPG